jgi:hypothetical protein
MLNRIEKLIISRPWIAFVDDERDLDHGWIVTLEDGYCFKSEQGCGVRGFDSWLELKRETKRFDVYSSTPT